MTRVSSQKIRQFLLVTGDPLDPSELPDKIQLFNEAGESLMIGGSYSRDEAEHTTASLAPNTTDASTLEMVPGWRLFKISTSRPARVRVYPTEAQQVADLYRPVGTKPHGNHGRLLEVVTTPEFLELTLSPAVDLASSAPLEGDFFISVTNNDIVAGSVVTTFNYVRTE